MFIGIVYSLTELYPTRIDGAVVVIVEIETVVPEESPTLNVLPAPIWKAGYTGNVGWL